jgi:hypothetical protein
LVLNLFSAPPLPLYDVGGRFTSYDGPTDGNAVTTCSGLGQLITDHQGHSGAVNINSTPKVQYAYTEMSGGANHSRLTSMT